MSDPLICLHTNFSYGPSYTSDSFLSTTTDSRSPTYTPVAVVLKTWPIETLQRETFILSHFIALKVRGYIFLDNSELHLKREGIRFKDLFDRAQPKARLEDLVRYYGPCEGVTSSPGAAQPMSTTSGGRVRGSSSSTKQPPSGSTVGYPTCVSPWPAFSFISFTALVDFLTAFRHALQT